MNAATTASLTATITAFVFADSLMPRIRIIETQTTTNTAGRLTMPGAGWPEASVSNGEEVSACGNCRPSLPRKPTM